MPKRQKRIILFTLITHLFLFNQIACASEEENVLLPQPEQEIVEMKVRFYAIDREKLTKGEFLGTAEFKDGKIRIDVTDAKLEKLLKEPYTTMRGGIKEGVAYDRFITYQPGTPEHFKAIVIECYRFGYISEIAKEKQ